VVVEGGASRARRHSGAATREALLLAAVELFAERGYAGVRVRHIAARAGVTTGAIYAHYDDVASLLADAAGRAVDHAVHAIVEAVPGEVGDVLRAFVGGADHGRGPGGAAFGVSWGVSREISRDQALLLEAFVAARREDRLREVLGETLRIRLLALEAAVLDAQAAGQLRTSLPADALAWFFSVMSVGLLAGRSVDLPAPSRHAATQVFDALFAGLSRAPNSSAVE
jgi:AcrR family transcriptional regulator